MSLHNAVKKMSKMMDEMGLTELDVEQQFLFGIWRKHIHLSKQQAAVAAAAAPVVSFGTEPKKAIPIAEADAPAVHVNAMRSPMVGVVYLAPEPGARPFVEVGKKVKAGDTLCLIEAMKTFNPVKAEAEGTVKEIIIKDGQAVEFDQPLMIVE